VSGSIAVFVLLGPLIFLSLPFFNSAGITQKTGSACASEVNPEKYFTQEQINRGRSYQREGHIIYAANCAVSLLVIIVFVFTNLSRKLEARVARISKNSFTLSILLYFLIFYLILSALLLPLSFYSSYIREKNYGFATLSLSRWFADYAKSLVIGFILSSILVVGLFSAIKKFPRIWHIIACAAFTVFITLMVFIVPVVIDPLFHRFTPLADANLRSELVSLAKSAGIDAREVLVMDASSRTTHTNAYFTGLSSTKRIVLYDTLIAAHSPSEVKVILAHEIGHWKYLHILKGILIACACAFVALTILRLVLLRAKSDYERGGLLRFLGVSELHAPSTLPLILLILFILGAIWLPAQNAISRHFEHQADRESLILTDDPQSFISAQVKLAVDNASDIVPPAAAYYFLYSHPSVMDRIAAAEDFAERQKKE